MTAAAALSSMREDIDALEAKQVVKPGHIYRRRAEVEAIADELASLRAQVAAHNEEATKHAARLDALHDKLHRAILWPRLWGIEDGTYMDRATGTIEVAEGCTIDQLQRAVDIRLEQFAKAPVPVWKHTHPDGSVETCNGGAHQCGSKVYRIVAPWLDGDWMARKRAVVAALMAASLDKSLQQFPQPQSIAA